MPGRTRSLVLLLFAVPLLVFPGCSEDGPSGPNLGDLSGIDFRQEMRAFVGDLSAYGKGMSGTFFVVTQNGQELMTQDGEPEGAIASAYVAAFDGVGQEDLFYGYVEDNEPTPPSERDWMLAFLDLIEANGKEVLVTDYCSSHDRMADSYQHSAERGYISFAADRRELDHIPAFPAEPYNINGEMVRSLADARNFLYLIDPGSFADRAMYLDALRATDYDLLIIDAFYQDSFLTVNEVASLKTKANGGSRRVLAYLSIGEAEDYRYYWQADWSSDPPAWLEAENPDWPGNYPVRYWEPEWQAIIYGSAGAYIDRVIEAGFDGVYLDIILAYEFFEELVREG